MSGLVIPPKDSQSIVNGLLELGNEKLREIYTENAYLSAKEKFSIENTYGKLDKIFSCINDKS